MKTPDFADIHRRDTTVTDARGTLTGLPALVDHDDVDSSLHQAQQLIGQAMSSRRRDNRQIRHLPGDDAAFQAAATELIGRARREILCVLAVRDMAPDRQQWTLSLLHGAQQRGVQVKALIPAPLTGVNGALVQASRGQVGYRTRTLPEQNLLISDGNEAALRTMRRDEPIQTLLISAHPLVHVLRSMFGVTWSSGVPVAAIFQVQEKLDTELARSILASLSVGDKDEVAARKLGVSVRTYRRHVADIMRVIRATSRFQAGARAAELGLLR
ncbi:hypothetical protein ACN27F_26425 [Solwaraspora sp. WMMB335]|uniref:hypothetical protein n=1 Tax=Solwaraspora sp. WMMB335 TaxID=3404118 RepID=UPI003B941A66